MSSKGDHPTEPHEAPDGHGAPKPDQREVLVKKRRARQSGASRRNGDLRMLMAAAVLVGGVGLLFVIVAPKAAQSLFGSATEGDQKASQVSLKVDSQTDQQTHLDFVVPGKEEKRPTNDPDADLKTKIRSLEDQLAKMQGGVSKAQLQQMLSAYNDNLAQQLEEQRKAMEAENARLREEAEKDAERAKQQAEELAKRQQRDQAQRESKVVIVDEGEPSESAASGSESTNMNGNLRFLKSAASDVVQTSVSRRLADPSRTVVQGTIISAVLETAIDTQLPGSVRAQVMRPVFSFDGTQILMPPGTILVGEFNNDVDIAQKRVLIAWNRAITPAGDSIALGSIGTDTLGRSGTLGNVDNRFATKFGAAALISAITAAPVLIASQMSKSNNSDTTINVGGGGQGGGGLGQGMAGQVSGVLDKYMSLPPVIRIPQGEEIRVFTNRDLIFR